MKKLVLIIVAITLLAGCEEVPTIYSDGFVDKGNAGAPLMRPTTTVVAVKEYERNSVYAKYILHNEYINKYGTRQYTRIHFVDSLGKYNVGDRIYFVKK